MNDRILVGAHVPPLPPMRDSQQIAETILGAFTSGQEIDIVDVSTIVDYRHPHGGSRLNHAVLILAHALARSMEALATERARDIHAKTIERTAKVNRDLALRIASLLRDTAKEERSQWGWILSPQKTVRLIQDILSGREPRIKDPTPALTQAMTDRIMEEIRVAREKIRSNGGTFVVEDIRPIIEKALS